MSTPDSRAVCFKRSVFSSSRLFPDSFSTTKSRTRQKGRFFLIAKSGSLQSVGGCGGGWCGFFGDILPGEGK